MRAFYADIRTLTVYRVGRSNFRGIPRVPTAIRSVGRSGPAYRTTVTMPLRLDHRTSLCGLSFKQRGQRDGELLFLIPSGLTNFRSNS